MKAELIDVMGDDLRVANAARVSFNKESKYDFYGDPKKDNWPQLSEKDQKLINYLASHKHWTPFSHCTITLRETVPIFVARQRFKHIIGFNYWEVEDYDAIGFTYNEVSRRYVDDVPEFYYPEGWRKRADDKKQGSSDELVEDQSYYEDQYSWIIQNIHYLYNEMIKDGVAPEQARMVLPQSMYTSYYVTGSLAAWARAFNLRSNPHAQLEIQQLAQQWDKIIDPLFPVSWKALTQ